MPFGLQTYNQYGGRINPAANALEGLQAGAFIADLRNKRLQAAQNYIARQRELDLAERAQQNAQSRFETEAGFTKQKLRQGEEELGLGRERLRLGEKELESQDWARKKEAEVAERNVAAREKEGTVGALNTKLRSKEYKLSEQKEMLEILGKWSGPIDTQDPEKFKRTFLPMARSMSANLNSAGFEDEAKVLTAYINVLSDEIQDSPETVAQMMEHVDALKKLSKNSDKLTEGTKPMSVSEAQSEVKRITGKDLDIFAFAAADPETRKGMLMQMSQGVKVDPKSEEGQRLNRAYQVIDQAAARALGQAAPAGPGPATPGQGVPQPTGLPQNIVQGLTPGKPRPVQFPDGSTHWLMLNQQGQPVEVQQR